MPTGESLVSLGTAAILSGFLEALVKTGLDQPEVHQK